LAEGENVFRVPKDKLAGLGQRQMPPTARKKLLSQEFFKLAYLCADGGLGDV
jgi:hypothetical protein